MAIGVQAFLRRALQRQPVRGMRPLPTGVAGTSEPGGPYCCWWGKGPGRRNRGTRRPGDALRFSVGASAIRLVVPQRQTGVNQPRQSGPDASVNGKPDRRADSHRPDDAPTTPEEAEAMADPPARTESEASRGGAVSLRR